MLFENKPTDDSQRKAQDKIMLHLWMALGFPVPQMGTPPKLIQRQSKKLFQKPNARIDGLCKEAGEDARTIYERARFTIQMIESGDEAMTRNAKALSASAMEKWAA